jgi:hypothetical protein
MALVAVHQECFVGDGRIIMNSSYKVHTGHVQLTAPFFFERILYTNTLKPRNDEQN